MSYGNISWARMFSISASAGADFSQIFVYAIRRAAEYEVTPTHSQVVVNPIVKTARLRAVTSRQTKDNRNQYSRRRVLKWVEEQIRVRPGAPDFDHFTPAWYFFENRTKLFAEVPGLGASLDRFERLFKDLNKLLPAN